jgi:hypothetical protein
MFGGAFQFSQNEGREWIRFDATNGPAIGEDFGLAFWLRVEHADDVDRSRTYTIMNKHWMYGAYYEQWGVSLAPCHGGFSISLESLLPAERLGSFDTNMVIATLTGDLDECWGGLTRMTLNRLLDKHVYNHIALSFTSGSMAVYLNGTLVDSMSMGSARGLYGWRAFENDQDRLEFGGLSTTNNMYGKLDDVVMLDFAPTETEVNVIMQQGARAFIDAHLAPDAAGDTLADDGSLPSIWGYLERDLPAYERYTSAATRAGSDATLPYTVRFANKARSVQPRLPPHAHPRILFAPSELQQLRARLLLDSPAAGSILGSVRSELTYQVMDGDGQDNGIRRPDGSSNFSRADLELTMKAAFVALMEGEWSEMPALAADLVALAGGVRRALEAKRASDPWWRMNWRSNVHDYVSAAVGNQPSHLGWAYDYLHPYMSEAQRDEVRAAISLATRGFATVGFYAVGATQVASSNWIPLTTFDMIQLVRSIEDEPGWDARTAIELKRVADRYFLGGVFSSGATYEGAGKAALGSQAILELQLRWAAGLMQTALATLHTHVGHWLLHRLSPWGGDSIDSDEFLGTSDSPMTQSDVMAAKYCFPSDLRVDFVHRNMLRGSLSACALADTHSACAELRGSVYEAPSIRGLSGGNSFGDTMADLISAQDAQISVDDEATFDRIADVAGRTMICCRRGIMITRSQWHRDAAHLTFQPRSVKGGHSMPNRGYVLLKALRRSWSVYANTYDHGHASVLHFDGVASSTLPATFVDFADGEDVTIATANLTLPYVRSFGEPFVESFAVTPQDAQGRVCPAEEGWIPDASGVTPRPEAWSSGWRRRPLSTLPNWGGDLPTGSYYGATGSSLTFHIQTPPILSYLRTAGLVRGPPPDPRPSYTAIVDTIEFGCSPMALQYGCNFSSARATNLSSRFALPEDLEGWVTANGEANATAIDPSTGNRLVTHALLLAGCQMGASSISNGSASDEQRLLDALRDSAQAAPPSSSSASSAPHGSAVPIPSWSYWQGTDTPTNANGHRQLPFRRLQADVELDVREHPCVTLVTLLFPQTADAAPPRVATTRNVSGFDAIDVTLDGSTTDRLWFTRTGCGSRVVRAV